MSERLDALPRAMSNLITVKRLRLGDGGRFSVGAAEQRRKELAVMETMLRMALAASKHPEEYAAWYLAHVGAPL